MAKAAGFFMLGMYFLPTLVAMLATFRRIRISSDPADRLHAVGDRDEFCEFAGGVVVPRREF
jgi:hypothetical protein